MADMSEQATVEKVFSLLADRHSVNILRMAYSSFKGSSTSYVGNLSKKQFYVRLRRLRDAGLIEKRGTFYKTTTLGSLIYNSHVKTMDNILANYWNLKAVDVLRARQDFPSDKKETVINEIIQNSDLKRLINGTHLSGFTIIKDFNHLTKEVLKLLDNAQKEIYFATRYYDQHVSDKVFERFNKGVAIHMLDGNPSQISVENRLNAILRVPPSKDAFDAIHSMIRSPRFDLKQAEVPVSFMVVDGVQIISETVNYVNPEQFTMAISSYDDPYLAQRFIEYFDILARNAKVPRLLASVRER